MPAYKLNIDAYYRQIWLEDSQASAVDREFVFTDEHLADRVWVDRCLVIMFTARDMTVPIVVELRDSAPDDDFAEWDHVAEASIEVVSDSLELYGCGGFDTFRLQVQPRVYRVRLYFGNLGQVSSDSLEGDDHYRIILWPDSAIAPRVLKRWTASK